MKTLTALLTALAIALGLGACTPTPAPIVVSTPASVELLEPQLPQPIELPTTITAPTVQLTASRVEVTTVPATVEVPDTVEVTTYTAPVYYVATPVQPTALPEKCLEEMPCWDCSTMGNLICGPVIDSYSGNPIVDCGAQGMLTAEDFTCVPASYYVQPVTATETAADPGKVVVPSQPTASAETATQHESLGNESPDEDEDEDEDESQKTLKADKKNKGCADK